MPAPVISLQLNLARSGIEPVVVTGQASGWEDRLQNEL